MTLVKIVSVINAYKNYPLFTLIIFNFTDNYLNIYINKGRRRIFRKNQETITIVKISTRYQCL